MLADFKTTTTENILKWNSGPSEQKHLKKQESGKRFLQGFLQGQKQREVMQTGYIMINL